MDWGEALEDVVKSFRNTEKRLEEFIAKQVLQPVIGYPSVDRVIEVLEDKIVRSAEAKFNELLARRTKQLRVENV